MSAKRDWREGLAPEGMKVNQELFDRLPALLSPCLMRLITGLDWRELRDLESQARIRVWYKSPRKGRKGVYRKYYKTDAAALTGFRM